jgi:glycosyltransferase involved in cell wall biosynthesis
MIPSPPAARTPFRIVFAGRLERNKGVLDIIEMARLLEQAVPGMVRFDICGDGPLRWDLDKAIESHALGGVIKTHGGLNRKEMLNIYAACHVVIVPTRSEFNEGFAKVCAEAILCGRPAITSPVVPAAETLASAMVIAETDNPTSYAEAIRKLWEDGASYQRLRANCTALQGQFYDMQLGLYGALEAIFDAHSRSNDDAGSGSVRAVGQTGRV